LNLNHDRSLKNKDIKYCYIYPIAKIILNKKEVKMIDGKRMLEIITSRQSDRRYNDKPIDKEKLDRITEAARMAPSACNGQPWKFVVITDPVLISKIAEACSEKLVRMNTFVDQAPALIIVIRERSNITSQVGATIKAKDYSLIDIGIASENICLQARAEGMGSCMIGWFDENRVRKILSIPRSKRVELIITLGYSLSELRTKKRKPAKEVISYNKY
jgi:nitroreductase